ncbi:MAG: hypothetical protein AAFV72_03775 [Cyanobacteria bacterium J06635_1]
MKLVVCSMVLSQLRLVKGGGLRPARVVLAVMLSGSLFTPAAWANGPARSIVIENQAIGSFLDSTNREPQLRESNVVNGVNLERPASLHPAINLPPASDSPQQESSENAFEYSAGLPNS